MLLESISIYSALLPILVFLLLKFKKRSFPLWVIFFYSLYSLINDSIILYRYNNHLTLQPFLAIFTVAEYILFTGILFYIIHGNSSRKLIIISSIAFVLFCLVNIINEQIIKFDSIQASIESILIISYCIVYFFEQINKPQISFIYSNYAFWLVIAILFSLAATFFLYVFASNLPDQTRDQYWVIQYSAGILRNILFALAIIIYSRPPKNSSLSY